MLLAELRAMIGGAEVACERYRQAVAEPGLGRWELRTRLRNLQTMQTTLAHLHEQQASGWRPSFKRA